MRDAETRSARPSLAGKSTDSVLVEALDAEAAGQHVQAWEDLAARALDPNPFMAPGFCLPAARHIAASASVIFLLVWERQPNTARRLIAVCPLTRPKLGAWPVARIWFHDLAALGAPLLDRIAAEPALLAVFDWTARHLPAQAALTMTALDRKGAVTRLLETMAERTGRGLNFLDTRQRAILRGSKEDPRAGLATLSRRRSKELSRQRRRLAEQGPLRYESAETPDAVEAALERFLNLEAEGWKGRAGTALASHPARTRFVRDMVHHLSARGQCRIDCLLLEQRPVAMGIVLACQDRHYFWKTAFAEDLGVLSPGVQFVLDLTRAQQGRDGLAFTDSCAAPDHPMIDRLWPSRIAIADAVVEITPASGWRYRGALALEKARRSVRARAKRLYQRYRPVVARGH